MNSRIVAAFVSRILSMINLPRESVTATEIVAWWTSMPIYFSWLITALLSVGGDANNHNLQQSGRLLYCVTLPVSNSSHSRETHSARREEGVFRIFWSESPARQSLSTVALSAEVSPAVTGL